MEEYVQALQEGDAQAACELLTKGAVNALEDSSDGDCEPAMQDAFAKLEEKAGDLEQLTVKEVNSARDIATATIEGPAGKTITELAREGGDWKVNSAPGG